MEELRSYCHIPNNIDFELPDGQVESTIGEEDGAVYFTREQLAVGLHFPVSSLIMQFLHFSGAPPALVHPNIIQILTECSVLNLLYQLDISLVKVFVYLHNEASAWRPTIPIGSESPTASCYGAPRLI